MKFIVYFRHPKGTRDRKSVNAFDSDTARKQILSKYPLAKITRVYNTGLTCP